MVHLNSTILVVDDSASDRALVGALVDQSGQKVAFAQDGLDALEHIDSAAPDVVLTDLRMPNLDGLELVKRLRRLHPQIPVILMTAHGSQEIAAEALRAGATSYVPKQDLAGELLDVLQHVLAISRARQSTVADTAVGNPELQLELNYQDGIEPTIDQLLHGLDDLGFDETDLVRIGTALAEALNNAIEHGNLELKSSLREKEDGSYEKLRKARIEQQPYCDRRVYVTRRLSTEEAIFVVRDDGGGFDPDQLPDPTDPDNLMKVGGRGMLLIRTFMDEVRHNAFGNEITMVKRRLPVPCSN